MHCSVGHLSSCGNSPSFTFEFVVTVNNTGSLAGRILPMNHDVGALHFRLKLLCQFVGSLLRNIDLKIVGNRVVRKLELR